MCMGVCALILMMAPLYLGIVSLLGDYTICREGDVLTHEQAKILV